MLFKDKYIKILFHKKITPTQFALETFYYAIEIGQIEFTKSLFKELDMQSQYGTECFIYLFGVKGNGIITINGKTIGIKKNDTLVFSTKDNVSILSELAEYNYIVFSGYNAKKYYDYLVNPLEFISFTDTTNIVMHFLKIKECITNTTTAVTNEAYISVSIECILAEYYTIKDFDEPIHLQVKMVTRAMDYIENNFMNDISLTDICKNIMYSPFHFSRIFKKETGLSPYEYLIHRRINNAKHLLITSNYPINTISTMCGYKSNIHFNNSFKSALGLTPKQYRNVNKIKTAEVNTHE